MDSNAVEDLIPIRLDLKVQGRPVTEYFTWNPEETAVTPTDFATILAADLSLPNSSIADIASSIADQIESVSALRQSRQAGLLSHYNKQRTQQQQQQDHEPISAGESRQILRLNVRIGRIALRDQFEWDVADPSNSPEHFAQVLCSDLGLPQTFVPAVACSIREQLLDLADPHTPRAQCTALDPLNVVRPVETAVVWGPTVDRLTVSQQEYLELKERREARLARRNRSRTPGSDRVPGPVPLKLPSAGPTRPYRRRSMND